MRAKIQQIQQVLDDGVNGLDTIKEELLKLEDLADKLNLVFMAQLPRDTKAKIPAGWDEYAKVIPPLLRAINNLIKSVDNGRVERLKGVANSFTPLCNALLSY